MSDDLLVMIKRLRIENEVNKVLMGSLIQYLLNKNKNELIDECLESINFTAEIVESQINKSWSEGEANYFRELINVEIKKFSLLYDKQEVEFKK